MQLLAARTFVACNRSWDGGCAWAPVQLWRFLRVLRLRLLSMVDGQTLYGERCQGSSTRTAPLQLESSGCETLKAVAYFANTGLVCGVHIIQVVCSGRRVGSSVPAGSRCRALEPPHYGVLVHRRKMSPYANLPATWGLR